MTERKEDSYDVSILSNSELMRQLPLEHQIMQITNPAIGEEKIFALTLNMSLDDQMLVEIANNFIKPLYQDKIRKYSDTPAILHPYRLVLAGDTTAGYRIATKLLHDVMEDFDVSEETIRGLFKEVNGGIDGERIIKGVKAFTREKKVDGGQEDYDEYIKRLRKTAGEDLYQTYLIGDKLADIVQNCLDPALLPSYIRRKIPDDMENKLNRMLNKYESAGAVLLDRTDVRRRKLNAAGEVPKRAQKNQYIFAA